MSIVSIVEKAFAGLIALLKAEATRHASKQEHHEVKAANHRAREQVAIANMKRAGADYRMSLYSEADKHAVAQHKAQQLADKIAKVIE